MSCRVFSIRPPAGLPTSVLLAWCRLTKRASAGSDALVRIGAARTLAAVPASERKAEARTYLPTPRRAHRDGPRVRAVTSQGCAYFMLKSRQHTYAHNDIMCVSVCVFLGLSIC